MTLSFVISSDQAEHPENTASDFRVTFDAPIDLDGEYQMCMSRCQTPPIFDVIDPEFDKIVIESINSSLVTTESITIKVGRKFFTGVYSLVDHIQGYVIMSDYNVKFSVGDSNRVKIAIPPGKRVQLSRSLATTLGYMTRSDWYTMSNLPSDLAKDDYDVKYDVAEAIFDAHGVPRLHWDQESMFIYCDLVTESFVGNRPRQLLGIASVSENQSRNQVYEPKHLHWYDVKLRHFNTINFYIRDEHDRKLPFENGAAIITIHLRSRLKLKNAARIL